ncbi:ADP-ribose pyrophosphatase YjhB, NUDIX family [Ruminococcaceae bacterium YRB3002]|nr:ADP-ribose pyrophosphatase YjhB, NUDIX family [Ruminococcaceae bacterium YRB3002]
MDDYLKNISRRLQAMAQAGLLYSKDKFDIERYHEIIDIAADLMSHETGGEGGMSKEDVRELFEQNDGYPTPKCDLRMAVFDDEDRILMVMDYDGKWTLPGGWCEYDHTLRENVAKEVIEESGIKVEPVRLVAVLDHKRNNNPKSFFSSYKFIVLCRPLDDGAFVPNIETTEASYFALDELPEFNEHKCSLEQIKMCLKAKHSEHWETVFD